MAFAACTASGPPPVTLMAAPADPVADAGDPHPRSTQWRITGAALEQTHMSSALEAIRRLRPEFLRASSRAPGHAVIQAVVYLDGAPSGDISMLNTIPLSAIREVRFLHASEALFRFGTSCACEGGVILVFTHQSTRR
jgi:hypothetical protein